MQTIKILFNAFGFNIKKFFYAFRGLSFYFKNYFLIKKHLKNSNEWKLNFFPCLTDRFLSAGSMTGHYFHQDLFIAKKIYHHKPQKHVDIGSRIDGFISHLAIFREVEVFDIRELESKVENITFRQIDCSSNNFSLENYCDSISSLHALEHFGLGRYGDKVDLDGHIKGLNNIYKSLKVNGVFYFSVPIGEQRIEFDAHRVFSLKYLLNLFVGKYKVKSFSYVDDLGDLHENVVLDEKSIETNFNNNFALAIFELIKKEKNNDGVKEK